MITDRSMLFFSPAIAFLSAPHRDRRAVRGAFEDGVERHKSPAGAEPLDSTATAGKQTETLKSSIIFGETGKVTPSPHISRLFVARRLKGVWMAIFPTEGRAGVVDATSSGPTEEKSADERLSAAVVEEV